MRIIISPAKKMKEDLDTLEYSNVPMFLEKTQTIKEVLKAMDYDALKALWKCNDQIVKLNEEHLCHMNLERNLTPAILSYEGI